LRQRRWYRLKTIFRWPIFLEEDHSDMKIRFSGQRDICRLGKLAEINVIYSTIKELLLQSDKVPNNNADEQIQQAEQT
jgi:hypothetical protein